MEHKYYKYNYLSVFKEYWNWNDTNIKYLQYDGVGIPNNIEIQMGLESLYNIKCIGIILYSIEINKISNYLVY